MADEIEPYLKVTTTDKGYFVENTIAAGNEKAFRYRSKSTIKTIDLTADEKIYFETIDDDGFEISHEKIISINDVDPPDNNTDLWTLFKNLMG